jgi:DNA-directed RNA polymerase specialized sigma24 family protein
MTPLRAIRRPPAGIALVASAIRTRARKSLKGSSRRDGLEVVVATAEDPSSNSHSSRFDRLVARDAERLRRALVARFGVEAGTEAFADAMAYAWEHRVRLEEMFNPLGYLYRVGLSSARPYLRWRKRTVLLDVDPRHDASDHDVDLISAFARLSTNQPVAVVMVHGHGATYAEVAEVLGITVAAVTNHVHRGLRRLRENLEVQ